MNTDALQQALLTTLTAIYFVGAFFAWYIFAVLVAKLLVSSRQRVNRAIISGSLISFFIVFCIAVLVKSAESGLGLIEAIVYSVVVMFIPILATIWLSGMVRSRDN